MTSMGETTAARTRRPRRTPRQWAGVAALALLVAVPSNLAYAATDHVLVGFVASASVLCFIGAVGMAVGVWGVRAVRGR